MKLVSSRKSYVDNAMDIEVISQRDRSLMERQRYWPRKQRSKRGGFFQRQERECVRSIIEPNDRKYLNRGGYIQCREQEYVRSTIEDNDYEFSNRGGYIQHQERECVRSIIEPNVHEYSNSFGSRFLQHEDNAEDPRTFSTNHSMVWMRSNNANPVENSPGAYMVGDVHLDQPFSQPIVPQRRRFSDGPSYNLTVEDVVPDQPLSRPSYPQTRRHLDSPCTRYLAVEDVVTDQPFSRPSYPQTRRHPDSPSYTSFRRDLTKYKSYHNDSRPPRSFKRKQQYHAKRREDSQRTRKLSQEYNCGRYESSPARKGRFTSHRGFKKPIAKHKKYGDKPKKPFRRTLNNISEERSYTPKAVHIPASKTVNSANMEAKCSKDDQVDPATKLATNTVKDNAEVNLKKELTGQMNKKSAKRDHKEVSDSEKLNIDADSKPHGSTKKNNVYVPNSKIVHSAIIETNCSKDNKVKSATKSATKAVKDNAEVNAEKQSTDQMKSARRVHNEVAECGKLNNDTYAKPHGSTSNHNEHVPVSKIINSAIIETKCSKDNEVKSASKLATKTVKGNAEVNPEKESTDLMKSAKRDHNEVADCGNQNSDADAKPRGSTSNHDDSRMVDFKTKCPTKEESRKKSLNAKFPSKEDSSSCYVKLLKDDKLICRTKCTNPPFQPLSSWNVDIVKRTRVKDLSDLPQFFLFPAVEDSYQKFEWIKFLTFLYNYKKVAIVEFDNLKIYVYPPESPKPNETAEGFYFAHALVAYELQELCDTSVAQGAATKAVSSLPIAKSVLENEGKEFPQLHSIPPTPCKFDTPAFESDAYVKRSSSAEKGTCSSISKCHEAVNSHRHSFSPKEDVSAEKNFVRADPSYLKTLGQAHSGWIFGAIAELVDNSRDARASRLEIAIEPIYDKTVGSEIPMLSIIDDGVGMNHQEILRMISFGHKQPDEDNMDCIGRFGVGFKTGSMRLGRDALVLTQTAHSRSVAFLSQSLNEGKDNLEIPVVSYCRQSQLMEIDTSVQSEALAKYNLNLIKEFSPFNEYLIGQKAGLFKGDTGTQIYIWNLDKWGSNYTLEWQAGMRGGSSFHQGDIFIRSRRVRNRPGQTSRKVHLDYSLRSYLEVIFLEPRMKIYVQDSLVKSRPLAKSLNNTAVINGEIMGKQVQLTLGRCQVEYDEANCGVFLYWHGRLIEAYKRVGGMIHSADMGRGVIGVIDVTELMDDGKGGVWVHSNKQGFQDCEPYACLEEWLGKKADEYWDTYFDPVQLKKGNARYKPDNEWVQCDKCRKWRMLNGSFDSRNLPKEWFCYMEPFNGKCEMPEQKPGRGVITVGLKRSSDDPNLSADCKGGDSLAVEGKDQDQPQPTPEDGERPVLKRLRRGPPRTPKK